MELGSVDQAKDLVKFHENHPPTVNGGQMEFRMSNTFSFLQVDILLSAVFTVQEGTRSTRDDSF